MTFECDLLLCTTNELENYTLYTNCLIAVYIIKMLEANPSQRINEKLFYVN